MALRSLHLTRIISAMLCFVLACNAVYGGNYELTKYLAKANIIVNSKIRLADPEFLREDGLASPSDYVSVRESSVGLVYGRQGNTDVQGNNWKLTVTYDLELTDKVGIITTLTNQVLEVGSGMVSLFNEVNRHNSSNGIQAALLTVKGVVSFGTVPADVQLELNLYNEKYNLLPVSISPKLDHRITNFATGGSEMEIFWSYIEGAESYDLEWIFLDAKDIDYATKSAINDGSIFSYMEPTRVNVTDNFFKLSLTYPDGRIFYRVRGVGRFIGTAVSGNYTHKSASNWFFARKSGGIAYHDISIANAFEYDKNWQVVQSFAEGGKNKKIVTIADETLRSRQILTNLSTNNQIAISETKYDYEGRPVINILPTVIPGSDLTYKESLNQVEVSSNTYTVFNKEHFDKNFSISSLADVSGAENYYSSTISSADFQYAQNLDFIPKSNGFPFTQVRYLRDNTGKMDRASGVGPDHKIDANSHDTKYYYSTPSSTQLYRLFGVNNVGNADHYKKVITADPNGQLSASYMDQEERVIATSLLGTSPNNVIPLEGNTPHETEEWYTSRWNEIGKSYDATIKIFNDYSKAYTFNYDLNGLASQLTDCKSCAYELEISIVDPDGEPVDLNSTDPNNTSIKRQINSNCISLLDESESFTVTLNSVGTYYIYKSLLIVTPQLTEDLISDLQDLYDIEPLSSLIEEYESQIDYSICDPICEGYNCLIENMTSGIFNNITNSECDFYRMQMLKQLSPSNVPGVQGGYYFDNLGGLGTSEIYNNSWLTTNVGAAPPTSICTSCDWDYVRNNWKPEFAEELLEFHPEFCFLDLCNTFTNTRRWVYEISTVGPQNWEQATGTQAIYGTTFINYVGNSSNYTLPATNPSTIPFLNRSNLSFYDKLIDVGYTSPPGAIETALEGRIKAFVNYTCSGCSSPITLSLFDYVDPHRDIITNTVNSSAVVNPLYSGGDITNAAEVSKKHWQLYLMNYINQRNRIISGYSEYQGCDYIVDDNDLPLPYTVVKKPVYYDPTPVLGNPPVVDADIQSTYNDIYGNMLGNCDEIRAAQIDYWVTQIKTNCNPNGSSTLPTVDVVQLTNFFNDVWDDASLDPVLDAIFNNNIGYDCAVADVPQIPNSLLYTWASTTGNPFKDLIFPGITPPSTPECYIPSSSSGCLVPIIPGSTCEDRVITWMGALEDACAALEGTTIDLSTTTLDLETSPCGFTFNAYCAAQDPPLVNPNIHLSDYLEFRLGEYCRLNSNVLNTTVRLTHNAISNDDNLKVVEEVLAAADCISLHELVQADHPEDQTCPKPSSCFSLAMDYVITHSEEFEGNELTITDPYLIECVGSNIITSNSSGLDLGNIGLLGIYGFDENYTAFTYPYLVPQPVNGTVVDYSIIGIATAPVVPNATFSGFAVIFKINDEEHPREYYYITRYIYCLPRGEEETAPACNLGVECPDIMDANTQPCEDFLLAEAIDAATRFWEEEIEKAFTDYLANYGSKCKEIQEYIKLTYQTTEHHYTLYYYDQAGNLVQTVPPKGIGSGVTFNSNTGAPSSIEPSHTYRTTYKYNALNQVVEQSTPDAGITKFWYNRAGQLKFSQNAQQGLFADKKYSFTKYDKQARIIAAGEVQQSSGVTPISSALGSNSYLPTTLDYLDDLNAPDYSLCTYNSVTITNYDGNMKHSSFVNQNYRSRVTSSYLLPTGTDPSIVTNFNASYYKYDELGNVNSIIQKIDGLNEKRTDYTYDLVSGKVNKVSYQPGQVDAFYHKYEYDADNRITNVYTSADNYLWDEDAEYFYYPHGPLARTEIGEDKVQGLDYYYTIHGWLKGVNMPHHSTRQEASGMYCAAHHSFPLPDLDPGKDGANMSGNKFIARDAMSFALGYYNGDYAPVNVSGATTVFSPAMASAWSTGITSNILPVSGNKGLYNGNIAWMITDLPYLEYADNTPGAPIGKPMQAMSYQYDQLNRIVKSRSSQYSNACGSYESGGYVAGLWVAKDEYGEEYKYDANGNITELERKGNGGINIDDLYYNYYPANNRLNYVDDNASSSGTDVQDQSLGNYSYDAIGNLTHDAAEEIDVIEWNVYGKIDKITRTSGSIKADLEFRYDPMGNRVAKIVKPRPGGTPSASSSWEITYYIRDASGNVMSTYNPPNAVLIGDIYTLRAEVEQNIYGSSRLGVHKLYLSENGEPVLAYNSTSGRVVGNKQYELSNHLGNVLATVSDKRIGIKATPSSTIASYYEADVTSAQDYYPFGMLMPGRSYSSPSYRYGFNGQEKDDEINGNGNSTTAEFWQYDCRLARRWNVDPIKKHYESSYVSFSNNPLFLIDPNGADTISITDKGKISEIISANGNHVLLDHNKKQIPFNDPETDTELINKRGIKVGDQLVYYMTEQETKDKVDGQGEIKERPFLVYNMFGIPGVNPDFDYTEAISKIKEKSYGDWDFSHAVLGPMVGADANSNLGKESRSLVRTYTDDYKYEQYYFFVFGHTNTVYNLGDAGNFMWGMAGQRSGFTYIELKGGSNWNEVRQGRGLDADADQRAIKAGFKFAQ